MHLCDFLDLRIFKKISYIIVNILYLVKPFHLFNVQFSLTLLFCSTFFLCEISPSEGKQHFCRVLVDSSWMFYGILKESVLAPLHLRLYERI